MNDEDNITINLDSISSNTGTYSITDSTLSIGDITFNTTSTDSITIGTDTSEFIYNTLDNYIDPDEVDRMCKEYPALSKVWRNFKSVYDMTLQDYEGKKKTGEINDEFPF
jgi:uncharacterized protein with NAD-binding domain and iron-sulfur cluster